MKHAKGGEVLQATTHAGTRVLKAQQYVGTVRLGGDSFTILPKIDYDQDRTGSATRNLLYMLEQSGYLPPHQPSMAPMLRRGSNWFELLTRIFALELQHQWQQGPHRYYQLIEADMPTLKGKWRLSEQLRRPARQHRFDVAFDDFVVDNPLSRVFRYITEQLWRRTKSDGNRRLLGDLRQWLDPVLLLPHIASDTVPDGIINRLNQRFEPLLKLCRLFLGAGSLELSPGDLQTLAFVFDMNVLFEEFICSFLRKNRETILPHHLRAATIHPQGRRHTRHLARTADDRRVFRLKPDIVFRLGSGYPLLLDTKYKTLVHNGRKQGVSQADFYQMFAYVHRYDAPRVVMLYPESGEVIRQQFTLEDHHGYISVATINLHRDLSRKEQRQALAHELREILELENFDGPTI